MTFQPEPRGTSAKVTPAHGLINVVAQVLPLFFVSARMAGDEPVAPFTRQSSRSLAS